jgi:hypothetical protein
VRDKSERRSLYRSQPRVRVSKNPDEKNIVHYTGNNTVLKQTISGKEFYIDVRPRKDK